MMQQAARLQGMIILSKRFLYDLYAIGLFILAKQFLSDHINGNMKPQSNNQAIRVLI